jgi:acyl carrier protein
MKTQTLDKIREIVARTLHVESDAVSEASSPDSLPGWDSVKHVQILMSVEEDLGVKLSEEQLATAWDVRSILEAVNAASTR